MKYLTTCVLTALALAGASLCAFADQPRFVPGEVLVKFKSDVSQTAVASLQTENSSRVLSTFRQLKVQRVSATKGGELSLCKRYRESGKVIYAEPNYILDVQDTTPTDPYFSEQWDLNRIEAPAAWDLTAGSNKVVVALIDTGVNYNHPDLVGRTVPGYDFQAGDNDPMDEYGHGTDCAGIIGAASNNGVGISGIAWDCMIMPLKVSDATGMSPTSCTASALIYAADNGCKVASISLGGSSYSSAMQDAVNYAYQKGCLIIAAAGNQGTGTVSYPAAYEHVIAVAATDQLDYRCGYSNYGSALDISAPGHAFTTSIWGGYEGFDGTSSASPHVSGVAALLFSKNPSLTPAQATDILLNSADDLGVAGWDQYSGYGRLNALAALSAPVPEITDTTPPTVALVSPSTNAVVCASVPVTVSVSDDTGVSSVELYCDGSLIGSTMGTAALTWNTASVSDGLHRLKAVAVDTSGNRGTSSDVSVTVQNAYSQTQVFYGTTSAKTAKSSTFTTKRSAAVTAALKWTGAATMQLLVYNGAGRLMATVKSATSPLNISLGTCPADRYRFDVRCNANRLPYTLTAVARN